MLIAEHRRTRYADRDAGPSVITQRRRQINITVIFDVRPPAQPPQQPRIFRPVVGGAVMPDRTTDCVML